MGMLNKAQLKNVLFSLLTAFFFFSLIEAGLLIFRYQPKIVYRSFQLPAWLANLDPVVLENYKEQLAHRGFVNEDVYAYQFDPILGYVLKPGNKVIVRNYSSAILVDKMPKWTILSNQKGFRISKNKKHNDNKTLTHTLYVLGDSSSFGWGVEYEETYGNVLKEKIERDSSAQYSLANYSLPGFTSFQGRLLINQIAKIKEGDLVFVSFGGNDSARSMNTDLKRFKAQNSLFGKSKRILNQLRSYKALKFMLFRMSNQKNIEASKKIINRVPIEAYKKNLQFIFQKVRKKGAEVFFIKICNPKEYARAAKNKSTAINIPYFDFPELMLPYLNKVSRGEIMTDKYRLYVNSYGKLMKEDKLMTVIFPDNCHPNAIGHRLMGEIIYDKIKDRIVPQK